MSHPRGTLGVHSRDYGETTKDGSRIDVISLKTLEIVMRVRDPDLDIFKVGVRIESRILLLFSQLFC